MHGQTCVVSRSHFLSTSLGGAFSLSLSLSTYICIYALYIYIYIHVYNMHTFCSVGVCWATNVCLGMSSIAVLRGWCKIM